MKNKPAKLAKLPKKATVRKLKAVVDGEAVSITGKQSIELRCGKACIRLSADGAIFMEGVTITSTADKANVLKGGYIALN